MSTSEMIHGSKTAPRLSVPTLRAPTVKSSESPGRNGVTTNPVSQEIVAGMLRLSLTLGLTCVLEGVQ
ncbi:MAG: hypothetical protein K2X74_23785, partial [Acetobacteraceae bacterium]|nr:hypothetical protein [Acetobacteraceae bacterium]